MVFPCKETCQMIADSNGVMLIKRRYRIIDIDKFDPVVGFGAVHRELDYGKHQTKMFSSPRDTFMF